MSVKEVRSPFNDKVVGEVKFSTYEEVESAIDLAYEKFLDVDNWLPKYKRVEILEKAMEIISNDIEGLTNLCASEGGKPYID
ncbi:MAG: aldehyde dehydrogenase family protein, partial [Campylobacterales bacterium]|nr:aldehyde dehydrogenase family protein [Campylobacterales bacterium]